MEQIDCRSLNIELVLNTINSVSTRGMHRAYTEVLYLLQVGQSWHRSDQKLKTYYLSSPSPKLQHSPQRFLGQDSNTRRREMSSFCGNGFQRRPPQGMHHTQSAFCCILSQGGELLMLRGSFSDSPISMASLLNHGLGCSDSRTSASSIMFLVSCCLTVEFIPRTNACSLVLFCSDFTSRLTFGFLCQVGPKLDVATRGWATLMWSGSQ